MDATEADIWEKMEIAAMVLTQCKIEGKDFNKKPCSTMTEFKKYTGRTVVPNKTISFKELVKKRDNHKTITTVLTSTQFRRALIDFYLNKRQIPTLEDINNAVVEKEKDYLTAIEFILIPLPGMSKGIIIEDPKVVFRRTLYLKKMEQVRKEHTHVIYVKHNMSLNLHSNKFDDKLFIAVSTRLGVLLMFFYGTMQTNNMVNWLIDCTKSVDNHCVFVIEEDEKETPKFSNKVEMSNWLTAHGIHHDSKAHRGELSGLIAKGSLQLTKSKVDDIVSRIRYEVIRYPKGMEELDYFNNISQLVEFKNLERSRIHKQNIMEYLSGVRALNIETWKNGEKKLVIAEEKMLQEDMMMEEVIDRLKIMAADGQLPEDAEGLTDAFNWGTIASEIIVD